MCTERTVIGSSVEIASAVCDEQCADGNSLTSCNSASFLDVWLTMAFRDALSQLVQETVSSNAQIIRGCFPSADVVDSSLGAYVLSMTLVPRADVMVRPIIETLCVDNPLGALSYHSSDVCDSFEEGSLLSLTSGIPRTVAVNTRVRCLSLLSGDGFEMSDVLFTVLSETVLTSPPPAAPAPSSPQSGVGFTLESWMYAPLTGAVLAILASAAAVLARFSPKYGSFFVRIVAMASAALQGQLPGSAAQQTTKQPNAADASQPVVEALEKVINAQLAKPILSVHNNVERTTPTPLPTTTRRSALSVGS